MYFIIILIPLFLLAISFVFNKTFYNFNTQFQKKLNFYKQDIYEIEKPTIQITEKIEINSIPSNKIIEHIEY